MTKSPLLPPASRRAVVSSIAGIGAGTRRRLGHHEARADRARGQRPQPVLLLAARRRPAPAGACCLRRGRRCSSRSSPAANSRPPRTPPPCRDGRARARPIRARHAATAARRVSPSATSSRRNSSVGPCAVCRWSLSSGMISSRTKRSVRSLSSSKLVGNGEIHRPNLRAGQRPVARRGARRRRSRSAIYSPEAMMIAAPIQVHQSGKLSKIR